MPSHRLIKVLISTALIFAATRPSEAQESGLAFPGDTGVLATPNAGVTPEGTIRTQLNNYLEPLGQDRFDSQNNLVFSLGLFPRLELGGRLAEGELERVERRRDLSGNAKLLLLDLDTGSKLALGARDFAGNAVQFQAYYLVASQALGPFQFSLGAGTDQLDGPFGGVEWRPHEVIRLMADAYRDEAAVGLGLLGPRLFGTPVRPELKAALRRTRNDDDDAFVGLGLHLPLGRKRATLDTASRAIVEEGRFAEAPQPPPISTDKSTDPTLDALSDKDTSSAEVMPPAEDSPAARQDALVTLQNTLAGLGLERIRTGYQGKTLLITYENYRFVHNFLDALGLVLAHAAIATPEGVESITAQLEKFGVPILTVTVPAALYRDFLRAPQTALAQLQKVIQVDYKAIEADQLTKDENAPKTWSQLIVQPEIRYFLATEVGTLDYSAALRADLQVPLWRGAVANLGGIQVLDNTDDLEEGGLYTDDAIESGLGDALLTQAFKPLPSVLNLTSAGLSRVVDERFNVISNETLWSSRDGHHLIRTRLSHYEKDNENHDLAVGTYLYYLSPLDTQLEVSYGQFFFEDRGIRLSMRRFFGDTAVTLFARFIDTDEAAAGVGISLPLTPRRGMKPAPVHVTGPARWGSGLETKLEDPNFVDTELLIEPSLALTLLRDYRDAGRLTPAYLKAHLLDLREAYFTLSP